MTTAIKKLRSFVETRYDSSDTLEQRAILEVDERLAAIETFLDSECKLDGIEPMQRPPLNYSADEVEATLNLILDRQNEEHADCTQCGNNSRDTFRALVSIAAAAHALAMVDEANTSRLLDRLEVVREKLTLLRLDVPCLPADPSDLDRRAAGPKLTREEHLIPPAQRGATERTLERKTVALLRTLPRCKGLGNETCGKLAFWILPDAGGPTAGGRCDECQAKLVAGGGSCAREAPWAAAVRDLQAELGPEPEVPPDV